MREREVDENRYSYAEPRENVYAAKTRLNLNDLLKRIKDQKKDNRKINLLILSGATSIVLVFFLILSL